MLGITGSALFDLPTGPLIVWSLLATAGLFKLFDILRARFPSQLESRRA